MPARRCPPCPTIRFCCSTASRVLRPTGSSWKRHLARACGRSHSIARGGTVGRRCAISPGTPTPRAWCWIRCGVTAGDGRRAQPRCGGRGVARLGEPRSVWDGWCWSRRRRTSTRSARSTTCLRRPGLAGWPAWARCAAVASCSAPVRSGAGSPRRARLTTATCAAAGRMLLAPSAWRSFAREQRLLVRDLPALERRLGEVTAPTTIVAGAADRVVPIAAARRGARSIEAAFRSRSRTRGTSCTCTTRWRWRG